MRVPLDTWLRSQNQRIIDRIRAAAGLGNQSSYSVGVAPSIQPVLVCENDVVPPLTYRGTTPFNVAAGGAGTRSEASIVASTVNFFPDAMLEVYVGLLMATGVNVQLVAGATISGATALTVLYNDLRLGIAGGIGVSTKNTAAATGTGTAFGGSIAGVSGALAYLGPFFLKGVAGQHSFMVRPSADNLALSGWFDWRVLHKAV